jgi:hypothetical protein
VGTLALLSSCREPTQFRLVVTSTACSRLTSLHVGVDGLDGGASQSYRDGGPSCQGDAGTELGDIVLLPGPKSGSGPVTVRVQGTLLGGSCTRGSRLRCIEATRSVRFNGNRTLPIALEAECADVECTPEPITGRERTCVVVQTLSGIRVPRCVATDLCADGSCTVGEDAGTPVDAGATCPSPITQPVGPQSVVWDFDAEPLVPTVGTFPAVTPPPACRVTSGVTDSGLPGCGAFLRCGPLSKGFALAQSDLPATRGFSVGFYLRANTTDVDLLRFEDPAPTGLVGTLRIESRGLFEWSVVDKGNAANNTSFISAAVAPMRSWDRVEVHVDPDGGAFQIWTDAGGADLVPGAMAPLGARVLQLVAANADLDRLEIHSLP